MVFLNCSRTSSRLGALNGADVGCDEKAHGELGDVGLGVLLEVGHFSNGSGAPGLDLFVALFGSFADSWLG
ncbi:MAG: hypothetical protein ACJAQT_003640 [Akkermansiaceae bacterium]|jgi:hypothetical protein